MLLPSFEDLLFFLDCFFSTEESTMEYFVHRVTRIGGRFALAGQLRHLLLRDLRLTRCRFGFPILVGLFMVVLVLPHAMQTCSPRRLRIIGANMNIPRLFAIPRTNTIVSARITIHCIIHGRLTVSHKHCAVHSVSCWLIVTAGCHDQGNEVAFRFLLISKKIRSNQKRDTIGESS